ncbi:MAG: hypothetical protein FJ119_13095 [Deltaproteobacteria bacterium]|nr:hypothetical protein [Deltaproteobacteria bacterium]
MKYRAQDIDDDYIFGNGIADFLIDSAEAVAQAILTRLRLWVGEWFLDTSEGTPYEQAVLGTNKMNSIEPAIRDRILETEGVESIEEFQLVWDSQARRIEIIAEVNTIYGPAPLNGVL